jgi:hypothetical protein
MKAKRIVNIYNFVRAVELRIPAFTPAVLRETTARQIDLVNQHRLPATFALQYDALVDPSYQRIEPRTLHCRHKGFAYRVACREGHFEPAALGDGVLLIPGNLGIALALDRRGDLWD